MYVDELLKNLKYSGLGCHIGHLFVGTLVYADDAVLLAPTTMSMKNMLKICSNFAKDYDVLWWMVIARLLINMYTQQRVSVVWGDAVAKPFGCTNGVKQGGVLSPIFLEAYVEEFKIFWMRVPYWTSLCGGFRVVR